MLDTNSEEPVLDSNSEEQVLDTNNNNNKYSCRQQWRVPPKIANQGKIYILHNLSLYRKIHAADLPMGYSI